MLPGVGILCVIIIIGANTPAHGFAITIIIHIPHPIIIVCFIGRVYACEFYIRLNFTE